MAPTFEKVLSLVREEERLIIELISEQPADAPKFQFALSRLREAERLILKLISEQPVNVPTPAPAA